MKYMMISATLMLSIISHAMEPEKIQLNRGILIAIEGIDGSGKSTLAKSLYTALQKKYSHVHLTKEPGGTQLGQEIREIIQKKPLSPTAEFLLFAADRAQHFFEMEQLFQQNYIIISDRLADSSLAYQGYGRDLDTEMIKLINKWAMNKRTPDLTIFVKVPVKIALERIQKRNETVSVFEKESLLEKVAVGFETIYSTHLNSKEFQKSPTKAQEYCTQQRNQKRQTVLNYVITHVNLTTLNPTELKTIPAEYIKLITIDGTQPKDEIADNTITVLDEWIKGNKLQKKD